MSAEAAQAAAFALRRCLVAWLLTERGFSFAYSLGVEHSSRALKNDPSTYSKRGDDNGPLLHTEAAATTKDRGQSAVQKAPSSLRDDSNDQGQRAEELRAEVRGPYPLCDLTSFLFLHPFAVPIARSSY
jgi:hypothetical protein